MKKVLYIVAVATSIFFTACSKEDQYPVAENGTFVAEIVAQQASKTQVQDYTNWQVNWEMDDEVLAVKKNGSETRTFVVQTIDPSSRRATFTGASTTGLNDTEWFAVFPKTIKSTDGTYDYSVPFTQKYGDLKTSDAMPMLGTFNADGTLVSFTHLFGVLKLVATPKEGSNVRTISSLSITPSTKNFCDKISINPADGSSTLKVGGFKPFKQSSTSEAVFRIPAQELINPSITIFFNDGAKPSNIVFSGKGNIIIEPGKVTTVNLKY